MPFPMLWMPGSVGDSDRRSSDKQRQALYEAVSKNMLAVFPRNERGEGGLDPWTAEQGAEMAARITDALLAGTHAPKADRDWAEHFLSVLQDGTADNYPADRPLTNDEQSLFAGYRGPGWTDSEFAELTPAEQKYALAPGEYWDLQRKRDLNLLQSFLGTEPKEGDPRSDAMGWYEKGREARWRTHDPSLLSTKNLQWFGGNYPEHDTTASAAKYAALGEGATSPLNAAGQAVGSLAGPLMRTDNTVGSIFNRLNLSSMGIQSLAQQEAGLHDSFADELTREQAALRLSRVSPVFGEHSSPAERIRQMRELNAHMNALTPMDPGKAHYLHTGEYWPRWKSLGMQALYDTADLGTFLTAGLGAWRGAAGAAAKGVARGAAQSSAKTLARGAGGLAGGFAGGLKDEFVESLPFTGAMTLSEAGRGDLLQDDTGDTDRLPIVDRQGEKIEMTPGYRKQVLEQAQLDRAIARDQLRSLPPLPGAAKKWMSR